MRATNRFLAGLLGLSTLWVAGVAHAQTYTFVPDHPTTASPIMVAAQWPNSGNFVNTRSVNIAGNTVSIRFVQDGGNFNPNPQVIQSFVIVPALAAGTYTFVIDWDPGPSYAFAVPTQNFTVLVAASGAVEPVPTLTSLGFVFLAFSLAILAGSRMVASGRSNEHPSYR